MLVVNTGNKILNRCGGLSDAQKSVVTNEVTARVRHLPVTAQGYLRLIS